MRGIFADTAYFVAVTHPRDQHAAKVHTIGYVLGRVKVITTPYVLAEVLNYFAERGTYLRSRAAELVGTLLSSSGTHVEEVTLDDFRAALSLYQRRLDKGYSLTDCLSMNVMRRLGVRDILTTDGHFRAEGFAPLL